MPKWGTVTRKGRVVYDRAPTKFKWCDARRIARSLPSPDPFSTEMGCFLHSVDMLLEHLPDEILAENVDFGPDFAISGLLAGPWDRRGVSPSWPEPRNHAPACRAGRRAGVTCAAFDHFRSTGNNCNTAFILLICYCR